MFAIHADKNCEKNPMVSGHDLLEPTCADLFLCGWYPKICIARNSYVRNWGFNCRYLNAFNGIGLMSKNPHSNGEAMGNVDLST